MKNYMPLIATQILNIDLYSLFRVKGKDINNHGNQTYYLGYDGLHSTKDEVNIDPELLNKILTGKAEIIYLKDKNKLPDNPKICDIEIDAIADRFNIGDLNLMEWKFIYYLIAKNNDKKEKLIIDFKEFEFIYHYSCNTLTNEKIMLESLLSKKLITYIKTYTKGKKDKNVIISITNVLNTVQKVVEKITSIAEKEQKTAA